MNALYKKKLLLLVVSLFIGTLVSNGTLSAVASKAKQQISCNKSEIKNKYDYIIVGGGMSGIVMATRLSECSDRSVLLIERGTNIEDGLQYEYQGPEGENFDKYCQAVMNANQFYARSITDRVTGFTNAILYYEPKGLGGLSIMSDQIFDRGSKAFWNSLAGEVYSWDVMVPYFKKIENTSSMSDLNSGERGTRGPLSIMRRTPDTLDQTMINKISLELYGKEPLNDYNSGDLIGISPSQLVTTLLSNEAGVFPDKRQTVFAAYLGGFDFQMVAANTWKSKKRKNLTILTNTIVDKLEYKQCQDGQYGVSGVTINSIPDQLVIKASKEVILCAGALNTPRILQNSHIDDFVGGIGENLHDHLYLGWASYEDTRPYPAGVKPSSYVMFASSDGSEDPDIMYHVVPTLRPRPNPKLGYPQGAGWIPLFKNASDISKWAWQKHVANTVPITADPNDFMLATVGSEDGYDILQLQYKYPNDPNANHSGGLFVTNNDLVGAKGVYDIPSDIEIYLEFKDWPGQDSGIFYRVSGGLAVAGSTVKAFGGYQAQNIGKQQSAGGDNTSSMYSEYGNAQPSRGAGSFFAGVVQGPIYQWGYEYPFLPERQIFTGWNSMRIQVRNVADSSICVNTPPLSMRVTVWLNDVLMYDVIDANPVARTDVANPAYPSFPVSCTVGKCGLQIFGGSFSVQLNQVVKYRNIAYRPLTAEVPAPSEFSNYFDWRFYTYITRHPLRGRVKKTCCDSFAKPVIEGLVADMSAAGKVNPLIRDQVRFAAHFLKLQTATSRLKFTYNDYGLYTADADLFAPTQDSSILNQALRSFERNPKDLSNYNTTPPYRMYSIGNRLGGSCQWGDGESGVVDTDTLRVKKFKNLRICDASVLPVPFASDMQAPVMAIAEKIARQIKQKISKEIACPIKQKTSKKKD